MMKTVALIVLLGIVATEGFLFGQDKWDGLKLTFGANPFNSQYFVPMPRTVTDATKEGWTKIGECTEKDRFGARYVKGGDHAAILLYDVNGYIAGIQSSVLASDFAIDPLQGKYKSYLYEDGDRLTATAFFTDPDTICTTGRSAKDFSDMGTGDRLVFWNRDSTDLVVPKEESEVPGTNWVEGNCFPAMGKHYFYDVSVDMEDKNFFQFFVLYNGGKLNAFSFQFLSKESSPRYEHPPASQLPFFYKQVPKFLNSVQLSSMHVYLTSSAAKDLC